VSGRIVQPAPSQYAGVRGRWDAADIAAFVGSGFAPSFTDLLIRVRDELTRHIEFAHPKTASLIACWVVGTYFHPLFTTFPRLNITGPKRTGKSKILQVIAAIAFNGLWIVAPTPAILFRLIEPLRPTFCLDEMESLDKQERKAIDSIINAGYKAGATVPRTEGDAANRRVEGYATFAPMALAGIAGLHDVLADRAITVRTQRGLDKTKLNSEVQPDNPPYPELRALAYRLALSGSGHVVSALTAIRAQQDSFTMLSDRPLELYRPLMALALLAKAEGNASFLDDIHTLAGCGKTRNPSAMCRPLSSNTEVRMRGDDRRPDDLFSYIRPEQRVPADHPLRPIRTMVDTVLRELSPEFARL